MKPIFKNVISTILIGTLLISSFQAIRSPRFDLDIVNSANLQDVILSAQNIAEKADDPVAFDTSFRRFCSTVQVLAGIESVIKRNDDTDLYSSQDQFFLFPPVYQPPAINAQPMLRNEISQPANIFQAPVFRPPLHC